MGIRGRGRLAAPVLVKSDVVSVSRILSRTIIYLGRQFPEGSLLPTRSLERAVLGDCLLGIAP